MQGFKHKGHVTLGMSDKSYNNPAETSVNFAVWFVLKNSLVY